MKIWQKVILVVAISILALGASGCKQKGPAEKAGEKIDESMDKAADKANELLGK